MTFSPNGVAYQISLSFSGASFQPGSANAMLVSRSTDGGRTWADPATLIRDGAGFFNDKNSITADPNDARFVYAVWDRLAADGGGPAYLARSVDGGSAWEAARPIYDPGIRSQTIGNQIVVLPNGTLVDLFTQIDEGANSTTSAFLSIIRSVDNGATWSPPSRIADLTALGASDPEIGTGIRDGSIIGRSRPTAAAISMWSRRMRVSAAGNATASPCRAQPTAASPGRSRCASIANPGYRRSRPR